MSGRSSRRSATRSRESARTAHAATTMAPNLRPVKATGSTWRQATLNVENVRAHISTTSTSPPPASRYFTNAARAASLRPGFCQLQ